MRKTFIRGLLLLGIILGEYGNPENIAMIFEGQSMAPTINDGDRLLIDQSYYDHHEIERGEMVLFEIKADKLNVKRILGLPGEQVQIKNEQFWIEGELLSEAYIFQDVTSGDLDITLGANEYFLVGDAMDMSQDSRHLGPVMEEDILGKIIKIN